MNRRAFIGALAALAAAPASALRTRFATPEPIRRVLYGYAGGQYHRIGEWTIEGGMESYRHWRAQQVNSPNAEAYENLRAAMRTIHLQCRTGYVA